jgi:hypothetical protein
VFTLGFDSYASYSKVPVGRPDPRFQIFPPKYGVFGTFICLVVRQVKNQVAVPSAMANRAADGQNLMIIFKILREIHPISKIKLTNE